MAEPTSHFIKISNRPIVQSNGDTVIDSMMIHYWEWRGHRPTVIFCHAGSLHGRCYDHIIESALKGFHVIALDLRGHGRSQKHPPPYHFRWIGEDVFYFIEAMKLSKECLIGIGHSLGGYALTWAAAISPVRLFRSLLLVDPGIIPRSIYGIGDKRVESLDYILRRKSQWNSVEEMIERMEKRLPFSQWPNELVRKYCVYAIDENCRLQCTPEGEHSMYQSGLDSDSNIFPIIEQSTHIYEIPIHFVLSELDYVVGQFDTSPTPPTIIEWFPKGKLTRLKNVRHFFPMDKPQVMIDLVSKHMNEDVRAQL